jgi:tRNA nucleotidyltransferase/poly(A) polymerase
MVRMPAVQPHPSQRTKEDDDLIMPEEYMRKLPAVLEKVRVALEGQPAYLVGGAVRDMLLDRPVHDLDIVLEQGGIRTARRLARTLQADFFPLDPQRDTGRVLLQETGQNLLCMDFSVLRGPSLEDDLWGRDFTLNAIALDLQSLAIFDPLEGIADLKAGRLRLCSPSACREDPLRIVRGVRLAIDYRFRLLKATQMAMQSSTAGLLLVSPERLRDELFRLLDSSRPADGFRVLDQLGALDRILPELSQLKGLKQPVPHVHDGWEHTLAVLGYLQTVLDLLSRHPGLHPADNPWSEQLALHLGVFRDALAEAFGHPLIPNRSLTALLNLAALYHDVAKPQTRQVDELGRERFWGHDQQGAERIILRGRALALSNAEIDRLATIVRCHMRILSQTNRLLQGKTPSRRSVYRFFRDAGPAGVDVCLLALADLRATYEQTLPQATWDAALAVVKLYLESWFEKRRERVDPVPVLDGNDLMAELQLDPGRRIGELLEAIREAQAVGDVKTRGEALDLARSLLEMQPRAGGG